ncbi:hypothetical protein Bbelb_185880 [Branchiostoma belcheri]|nr:hypothetical protein Bbelb_185880 [Branchiostoma belcheri]
MAERDWQREYTSKIQRRLNWIPLEEWLEMNKSNRNGLNLVEDVDKQARGEEVAVEVDNQAGVEEEEELTENFYGVEIRLAFSPCKVWNKLIEFVKKGQEGGIKKQPKQGRQLKVCHLRFLDKRDDDKMYLYTNEPFLPPAAHPVRHPANPRNFEQIKVVGLSVIFAGPLGLHNREKETTEGELKELKEETEGALEIMGRKGRLAQDAFEIFSALLYPMFEHQHSQDSPTCLVPLFVMPSDGERARDFVFQETLKCGKCGSRLGPVKLYEESDRVPGKTRGSKPAKKNVQFTVDLTTIGIGITAPKTLLSSVDVRTPSLSPMHNLHTTFSDSSAHPASLGYPTVALFDRIEKATGVPGEGVHFPG